MIWNELPSDAVETIIMFNGHLDQHMNLKKKPQKNMEHRQANGSVDWHMGLQRTNFLAV